MMGQNGQYSNVFELIEQYKLMKDHSASHTYVIGFLTGTDESRSAIDRAMLSAFGNNFINARKYITTPIYSGETITSCYGLNDAGITPTSADLEDIAVGHIPASLRSDDIHLNKAGNAVLGNYVYRMIFE